MNRILNASFQLKPLNALPELFKSHFFANDYRVADGTAAANHMQIIYLRVSPPLIICMRLTVNTFSVAARLLVM